MNPVQQHILKALQGLRVPKEMVARWVFPSIHPESAKRGLRRYIAQAAPLYQQLIGLGYNLNQHSFTTQQAMLIHEWFVAEIPVTEALTDMYNYHFHHSKHSKQNTYETETNANAGTRGMRS